MSTMSPAGLAPVSAPLPTPRKFTLLDAAQLVNPESDRWLGGAWIEGFPPGPAHTHDPCSAGTYRAKHEAGVIPSPIAGAFTVYLPASCVSFSIGPDPADFEARLRLVFEAYEAAAVERVFATGDGHSTLGAYLTDDNLEVLNGTVAPIEGLALLEKAIAEAGGDGIIHAPPEVVTHWSANGGVEAVGTGGGRQLQTVLGTRVAAGAGYIDARHVASSDLSWAFASGPVQITRSEVFTNPADYAQALDRSNNDVLYIAERHYLINWVGRQDGSDTGHVQAGVLIDRTS